MWFKSEFISFDETSFSGDLSFLTNFEYIKSNLISNKEEENDEEEQLDGCSCISACQKDSTCDCFQRFPCAYDDLGRLLDVDSSIPVVECNSACFCLQFCPNRVLQNGRKTKLEIFYGMKGVSIRTPDAIRKGQFVIEYCGKVVSTEEAHERERCPGEELHTYLLCVQEQLSTSSTLRTILDASDFGNEARFVNHSCSPNLVPVPVRVDSLQPRVGLFALRDVQSGEELTFDYGCGAKRLESSGKVCLCASDCCRGYLPFQSDAWS